MTRRLYVVEDWYDGYDPFLSNRWVYHSSYYNKRKASMIAREQEEKGYKVRIVVYEKVEVRD